MTTLAHVSPTAANFHPPLRLLEPRPARSGRAAAAPAAAPSRSASTSGWHAWLAVLCALTERPTHRHLGSWMARR